MQWNRIAAIFLNLSLTLAICTVAAPAHAQTAATTTFTYQGQLRSGTTPVNGPRDLKFRLYDAPTAGNQIGSEMLASAVELTEGQFTVQLNFGVSAFTGQARWIEISVSDNASGPPFTILAPRQALTATPYAMYALNTPVGPGGITASVNAQFSQDDRSGWTRVETLGDDSCFGSIPLGFTFTGWGRAVTSISVSSNGLLFFGQNCSATFTNTLLPSGISQDPFLAFFWDDLNDFGTSEFFEYATFGSAGGRVFNLYFHNRLLSGVCGSNAVNIMVSIHEGSNLIRVSYTAITDCANMKGSTATFGLQGPGGAAAQAYVVSVNAPIFDDDNPAGQSISFQPPR